MNFPKIKIILVNFNLEWMFISLVTEYAHKVWYLTVLLLLLDAIVSHYYGFLWWLLTTVLWQGSLIILLLNWILKAIRLVLNSVEETIAREMKKNK